MNTNAAEHSALLSPKHRLLASLQLTIVPMRFNDIADAAFAIPLPDTPIKLAEINRTSQLKARNGRSSQRGAEDIIIEKKGERMA